MKDLKEKLACLTGQLEELFVIRKNHENRLLKFNSTKDSGRFRNTRKSLEANIRSIDIEIERIHREIETLQKMLSPKKRLNLRAIKEEIDEDEDEDDEDEDEDKHISSKNLLFTFKPRISFNKVILPSQVKDHILSVLAQIRKSSKIFDEWGLKNTIHYGKGTVLLFTGLPGTGKTLAAEAIAKELGKKVSIVNYSQLHNMWKGNTEKQICKVFKDAKESGNLLVFDEADGIITRRSKCDDFDIACDNGIKVYFLQELEKFEGIIIMTTNLVSSLDKALERRLSATVFFEMPAPEQRLSIWKLLIGKKMPLAQDVDLTILAKKYQFSGGHIKNAVLGAARLAVVDNSKQVCMKHFEKAAEQVTQGQSTFQNCQNEKQNYFG